MQEMLRPGRTPLMPSEPANRPSNEPSTRCNKMPKSRSIVRFLTPLMPLMLLMGCAAKSPSYSPQIERAAVPALPSAARQPKTPAICLPSCSTNLSSEIESWQRSLILPE